MATSDNGDLNKAVFGSNTNDPNNSLLKKVTKRVSGLFPSSLTKWFGPSTGPQAVVRRRDLEDDDEEDGVHTQQPPKKRCKPSSDADFSPSNSFTITSTPLVNSRHDMKHLQPGPSGYTRPTTQISDFVDLSATNGDDNSDSGESTSGYSSVQHQQRKESSFVSDRGNNLMMNQPSTSKQISPNKSLNSSRSLFSEQSLNPSRQCMNSRRPSFSASTFGSPSFVDRTLSTNRAVNSPFYGGRTMYGGASSYRRKRILFTRDDSNNISIKNSVEIKPVNDVTSSNDSVNLSKTARRILDALEHFSTPVLDAKKIPNINRQTCDLNKNAKKQISGKTAPNRGLIVPIVPDLIKMKLKERLQESTVQVRKVATTSKSVLNSEYKIKTVEEASKPPKHVNKIKTKVTSMRNKKLESEDTVEEVKLPEVKLPITNLPKFDFTLPPPPKPVSKPSTTVEIDSTDASQKPFSTTPTSKTVKSKRTSEFTFEKPIIVSDKAKCAKDNNSFKFSEPLNAKSETKSTAISTTCSTTTSTSLIFNFNSSSASTAPRRKEPSKNNGQNSVGFSLAPPSHFVAGSVMDVLGKSPESKKNDLGNVKKDKTDLMDKFKPGVGTWECNSCMVRNLPTATRCVACETLKEPPKRQETQNTTYGFGNKFKMNDKWECGACLVRNNASESKCVACTTPKASSESASIASPSLTTSKPLSKPFDGFGDKFKPETGSWECSSCLLRNKTEAVKCIACETPKQGSNDTKSSLIMPSDLKTSKSDSGFKDFIKKQQKNWECPSCMVRNPVEKKNCACCEAPKPGEPQEIKFGSTQIKFGINTTETPPVTFSFGIKPTEKPVDSKPSISLGTGGPPVTTGFTFGIPAKKTEEKNESNDKPTTSGTFPNNKTESTQFKFSAPVSTTAAIIFGTTTPSVTTNFTFGKPASVTEAPSKAAFSFGATSSTNTSPVATTSLFGKTTSTTLPIVTTPAVITPTTSSVSGSATAVTLPITSVAPSAVSASPSAGTFNFGGPTNAKPLFGPGNKVPQFNFGSGGLPFNPVYPTTKPSTVSTNMSTTTIAFGKNTSSFSSANNKPETPAFGGSNYNFQNKSEVKPFSFTSESPKNTGFSFTSNENPSAGTTGAPLAKAPVFNFGASTNTAANSSVPNTGNNLFNFAATKTGNSTIFGDAPPSGEPQNGGFNFGSTNSPQINFNFGGGNNPSATPAVFGFGSSQAGSGSAPAAPGASTQPTPGASASGVFTFGAGAPVQQAPTFSPDIKPNFNFTGGSLPNFTAQGQNQGAPASGALVQRKIRKAVRRTQPR